MLRAFDRAAPKASSWSCHLRRGGKQSRAWRGSPPARSDGTYCYAADMRSDGLPGIDLQEEGEVRIRFNPLTLLPGTFFVHAVIFEPLKHTHYDFREHAAMFKVRSDRTDYGVCVLPHRWMPAGAAMPEDQGPRTESCWERGQPLPPGERGQAAPPQTGKGAA